MRTLASLLTLAIFFGIVLAGDDPPREKKKETPAKKTDAPLQVGGNLPASFHPYNVTGPHKQHFHSLIAEHGLDPMVMIFYKGVEFGDPLPDLLKKIDAAIEENPGARLDSFAVFLPDDLPEVVGTNNENDDARLELEKKIDQAAADMKLKHVVFCLDSKSDVEKFGLSETNLITVVLYSRLKVVDVFALPKSDFKSAAVEKIMSAVTEKLIPKRKKK
jgi:hypothetical protein